MEEDRELLESLLHTRDTETINKQNEITSTPNPLKTSRKKAFFYGIIILLCLVLLGHIYIVSLVQKTRISLKQLIIPDLCDTSSTGEFTIQLNNPSYCAPVIETFEFNIYKSKKQILQVQIPSFSIASGTSTVISTIAFHILKSPIDLLQLIRQENGAFEVFGQLKFKLSCLLIPITMEMNIDRNIVSKAFTSTLLQGNKQENEILYKNYLEKGLVESWAIDIAMQILRTIGLSHFHVQEDTEELFAFTEVSFDYESPFLWNIPSLSIQFENQGNREGKDGVIPILSAGFQRFQLGNGKTLISAFTEIRKNQTAPIQDLLLEYLKGNDMQLLMHGQNGDTNCFSLEVLDLWTMPFTVPSKIDNKPVLLRGFHVQPSLKKMNSRTKTCLLTLDVAILMNNPLPIRFDLYDMMFDLYYKVDEKKNERFLFHINNQTNVIWPAHEENAITLHSNITDISLCKDLMTKYFQNHLRFGIKNGHIYMGAANGNFTIPFSVDDIPIKPALVLN